MTNEELKNAINSTILNIVIAGDNWITKAKLESHLEALLKEQQRRAQDDGKDTPCEAAAVLPNGAIVSNVYEAYEEGLKQSGR